MTVRQRRDSADLSRVFRMISTQWNLTQKVSKESQRFILQNDIKI